MKICPVKRNDIPFVQNVFGKQFSNLGNIIAKHPTYFVIIPVIITAALSLGAFKIKINRDFDWLYTETGGRAAEAKMKVEKYFPFNTSEFADFLRSVDLLKTTTLITVAKDGGSMLRDELLEEVLLLEADITNLEVEWKGTKVNYSILCGKQRGECVGNRIQKEIASKLKDFKGGKSKIMYPIDNTTFDVKEYVTVLGGVELDEGGFVRDLKALRDVYFLDYSDETKNDAIQKWKAALYNYFETNNFNHIEVSYANDFLANTYFVRFAKEVGMFFPIIFSVILFISVVTCFTNDWISSKPWLGISACLSACLAIISGFGLSFLLGVDYQDFNITGVYCVLVLEVDDAFVLISSWRNTDPNDSVEKRMEDVYYDTMGSITITSLTNMLASCIGIATSLPAFYLLCSISACCNLFAYIYQITFFGGCLALSGYREKRNIHPLTFRRKEETRNECHKEGSSTKKGDFIMAHFRDTIGELLTRPLIKGIVIIIFLINLATGLWGLTFVKFGNDYTDIYPSVAFARTLVQNNHKYFGNYYLPVHLIIKEPLNYADNKVQMSLEHMFNNFETHPHIVDSTLRVSWLKYYKEFSQNAYGEMLMSGYNMSDKQDFIDGLKYVFLKFPQAEQFKYDINFNENYTDIISSRFLLPMKDISSTPLEVSVINDIMDISSKSNLPGYVFGATFHYVEQAWIVKDVSIKLAAISTALICFVFFAFTHNILYSIWVSFIVLCSICETIGSMSYWGVSVNFISLLVILSSVGFSINYPGHICFSYMSGSNVASSEKIRKCIYEIGFPIIQGFLTTVLSVLPIYFYPHHITVACFKVLFLVSVLTSLHAIFVLPIILSLSDEGVQFISRKRGRRLPASTRMECAPKMEEGKNDDASNALLQ